MKPSWDCSKYLSDYQIVADAMNYYNPVLSDDNQNTKEENWEVFSLLSKMVMFFNSCDLSFYETITKYKDDLLQLRENTNNLNGKVVWASNGELLEIVNSILEDCPNDVVVKPINYVINF